MKTLVANFGRSIYQICPAVRGGEHSHRHRLEFQMLEWYRCQYKLSEMAGDLRALLRHVAALLRPDHELEVEFELARVGEVEGALLLRVVHHRPEVDAARHGDVLGEDRMRRHLHGSYSATAWLQSNNERGAAVHGDGHTRGP